MKTVKCEVGNESTGQKITETQQIYMSVYIVQHVPM